MSLATVTIPTFHEDQLKVFWQRTDARATDPAKTEKEREAWAKNAGGRFRSLRCGRRWGKSTFGETWIEDGAIKGYPCGWFAPSYKYIDEVYENMRSVLEPITRSSSKTKHVIRLTTGGRIDFWTLEDVRAGRSRHYKRTFIDEAAFTGSEMKKTWEQSIKPTLLDLHGSCIVASNTNGIDEENFLWQACNDPSMGFIEYHAPSIANPTIPLRRKGESEEDHMARRVAAFAELQASEHPLVFLQEYKAEFVDWSGVAFFSLDKLLVQGKPVDPPVKCDVVFAVIDSASKTGTANDGTAVAYFALTRNAAFPLVILDWDIFQIEGATLENWLPNVFANLETLSRSCGARSGSAGVFIEDANSGTILIQQAQKKGLAGWAIDSILTSMGKDERSLSVSGYVYRGSVKLSQNAYDKVAVFKGASKNHLVSQITGFRMGDKDNAKRADDLLDTFTYGIALSLGDRAGI